MPVQFVTPMVEVGIVTDNTEEMLRFYRDILGLPYIEHLTYPEGSQHRFAIGDSILKLAKFNNPASIKAASGGPFGGAQGMRYFSLPVKNVRQMVEEVRAAGYAPMTEVREFASQTPQAYAAPALSFAFIADPDGNWIELYGPPSS
jgi:catechol 2,3-dioxygenase-like lactoylglutathione lyase family enzyme